LKKSGKVARRSGSFGRLEGHHYQKSYLGREEGVIKMGRKLWGSPKYPTLEGGKQKVYVTQSLKGGRKSQTTKKKEARKVASLESGGFPPLFM